jgi:hypothetical protein
MVQKPFVLPAVFRRGLYDPVTLNARHWTTTDPSDIGISLLGFLWHANKKMYFRYFLFS